MPDRLKGRIAIITGSSSGIGRAISFAFAAEGAKVVCADLREESSRVKPPAPDADENAAEIESDISTHERIKANGGEAIFVKVDVTNPESVEHLVQAAVKQWGRLDIMVNNAGFAAHSKVPVWETSLDDWQKTLDINLNGVFYGIKYAAAQMVGQEPLSSGDRGWIMSTCSVYGLKGAARIPAYCSSKGAVANLTRSAALDCAPYRVHVNAVCPGYVATNMTDSVFSNAEVRQQINANHPFKGIGKPEDVAKAYVFLASDDAQWMTGVNMPVDGGFTA